MAQLNVIIQKRNKVSRQGLDMSCMGLIRIRSGLSESGFYCGLIGVNVGCDSREGMGRHLCRCTSDGMPIFVHRSGGETRPTTVQAATHSTIAVFITSVRKKEICR